MKTVYIPKGEIVRYESLMTEHLIVHGCLQVSNGIKARTIAGQGTINAGSIDADVIRVDDVEAGSVVCKRLLAKRVQSPEVFASESAAVSCFLSAAYVETGRLTVTLSEIDEVKAEEVVNLTGHMYFVPHTYMDQVDIFEDFILLLSGLNKKATPLVVNSFYIIDDAKQREKMTEEFYLAVKKEIAAYQEKCDYLIKSTSQSPAVMDRWVLKVRALEEKKRHYEGVLQRELSGLDDEFSVLKLLSQELQVRANSIRSQRFQQRAA